MRRFRLPIADDRSIQLSDPRNCDLRQQIAFLLRRTIPRSAYDSQNE